MTDTVSYHVIPGTDQELQQLQAWCTQQGLELTPMYFSTGTTTQVRPWLMRVEIPANTGTQMLFLLRYAGRIIPVNL